MRKLFTTALLTLATTSASHALELTSPELKPGQLLTAKQVFNGFGCSGDNLSPALSWRGQVPGRGWTRSGSQGPPRGPLGGAGAWTAGRVVGVPWASRNAASSTGRAPTAAAMALSASRRSIPFAEKPSTDSPDATDSALGSFSSVESG